MANNPLNVRGIEFLEFAAADPTPLASYFTKMGLVKTAEHAGKKISIFSSHEFHFLLNSTPGSFAETFQREHGPAISAMGWRVDDAKFAFNEAVKRGAKPFRGGDQGLTDQEMPAVYGIGDSLIYFLDANSPYERSYRSTGASKKSKNPLLRIDHLTNNVPKGEMDRWCDFYAQIFGFINVRYFDIKGTRTGLISKVMTLEDRSVMIPINEPSDGKSQIQEYLDEYHGSGIQHVALSVADIVESVDGMTKAGIPFLDTPASYYETVKTRVPMLTENVNDLRGLKILADGDEEGYLLQIFTKNAIGPIFFELIHRKNHWGFGNGNFQALFDAIERDQMARGYLT
jgi:4-hydroxyphenylpyruvate dioxygenase